MYVKHKFWMNICVFGRETTYMCVHNGFDSHDYSSFFSPRYSHADCSGHGVCIEGVCTCDATWTGEACDEQVCPNNCSAHHGQGECNREKHHCECARGFKGKTTS